MWCWKLYQRGRNLVGSFVVELRSWKLKLKLKRSTREREKSNTRKLGWVGLGLGLRAWHVRRRGLQLWAVHVSHWIRFRDDSSHNYVLFWITLFNSMHHITSLLVTFILFFPISCTRDPCIFLASLTHLISHRYIYSFRKAKLLNVGLRTFEILHKTQHFLLLYGAKLPHF